MNELVTPRETFLGDENQESSVEDATVEATAQDNAQEEGEVRTVESLRDKLQPFGYDLFSGTPSTFAPVTDIPVPVDYVFGPGDNLRVQLFGKESNSYTLTVNRQGNIDFPELGPISVAGLSYQDVRSLLQQTVSERMIGMKAAISMGELRSIRIFVLGEAFQPGTYTVSSLSTVTHALFAAGGLNDIASLRNIQVKRNGKVLNTFDLYDFLLKGDTSNDVRLQAGDVVFIPPFESRVGIGGEIKRPAYYELKNEQSVSDVISLAGGFKPTSVSELVQIERVSNNGSFQLFDLDLTVSKNVEIFCQKR